MAQTLDHNSKTSILSKILAYDPYYRLFPQSSHFSIRNINKNTPLFLRRSYSTHKLFTTAPPSEIKLKCAIHSKLFFSEYRVATGLCNNIKSSHFQPTPPPRTPTNPPTSPIHHCIRITWFILTHQ